MANKLPKRSKRNSGLVFKRDRRFEQDLKIVARRVWKIRELEKQASDPTRKENFIQLYVD